MTPRGRRRLFVTVNAPRPRPPRVIAEDPVRIAHLVQVVALVTLTLLWLDRHLGVGLRGWGPVAGLLVAAGVGWNLVKAVAGDAASRATSRAARLGRIVFSRRVRVGWAIVLAVFVSFVSSMTFVGASAVPPRTALEPVDDRAGAVWGPYDEKETRRWVVLTSPLGALFSLAVPGYLREPVEVFPVLGQRLYQRDLRQTLTVLLRPGVDGLRALEHGRLDVWLEAPGGRRVAVIPRRRAAFLVGARQSVPASWIEDWRLELKSLAPDETAAGELLLTWKKPEVVAPEIGLQPGMVLVAEIRNQTDNLIASATTTLGTDTLADVYVPDLGGTR